MSICPLWEVIDIWSVSGFCKQLRHLMKLCNLDDQNISHNSQKSEICSSSSRSSWPFIHSVLINTCPQILGYFLCWTSLSIEVTCLFRVVVCSILLWHTSWFLLLYLSEHCWLLVFPVGKILFRKRKKSSCIVTFSLLSSERSISCSRIRDEMGPVQKYVLQPRHQALLIDLI